MRRESSTAGRTLKHDGEPGEPGEPADSLLDLGPLPSTVGYALRRAQLAVFADFDRAVAHQGLRPAQYSVLLLLRHNLGARASQLAETRGIQRTNFTGLLAELMQAGLVQRGVDPRDRRAATLHLTQAGMALLAEADAAVAQHDGAWRDRLGAADHARLLELLARLTD